MQDIAGDAFIERDLDVGMIPQEASQRLRQEPVTEEMFANNRT